MADMFSLQETYSYDILALQEPFQNQHQATTYHPAKDRFHLLYFNSINTRTCFFINKRIDPRTWNIKYINGDICILQLETPSREHLWIYNVYNEPGAESATRTLEILDDELQGANNQRYILLLGDFNLHHPQWSGICRQRPSPQAHNLLRITSNSCLWQVTPKGLKTHRCHTGDSTIDLAFTTHSLRERLVHCRLSHELDCDSDHLPINIQFNWEWEEATRRRTRNWHATDIDKLRAKVKNGILSLQQSNVAIQTLGALDDLTAKLIHILVDAIDTSTPWHNPSPRAISGFDSACKRACAETQQLRRVWQLSRLDEDRKAYNKARNQKGRLISKHLRQAYRDRVTDAASSPKGLWKITKWAVHRQETPTTTITPPLSKPDGSLETTPEGKAQLLKATFFPPPFVADLRDIAGYDYPTPHRCPVITEAEIERAVRKAALNKAPGTDGITNGILQKVLDLILPTLHQLFNSSLDLGHFPRHFRESITVVLRKPGKDDYSMPKSYRPIALLNTLGKALEAIIATRLMYLADHYDLLPQTHIGGRRMRSTEHAVHILLEEIHKAWRNKQVASLLLLDVSGAFDNVSHPRLLHNLRKRKST